MTSTIKLRALEPEDLQLVYEIENDPALWQWGANSVPLSRYTVRQYLAEQHSDIFQDGQLRLVVTLDNQPVGIADLVDFEPRHRHAEVGIVVLAAYQRRGVAAQALRLLEQYATDTLHLSLLYAYVAEQNTPAQQLFRAVGYEACALIPRWIGGDTTATLFIKKCPSSHDDEH